MATHMRFSVGDWVVHPSYGPGTVTGIVAQVPPQGQGGQPTLDEPPLGDYLLRFRKDLAVRLPWRRADEVGMRPLMTQYACAEILERLRGAPATLPTDHKARRKLLEGWIYSSSPADLALAIGALSRRQRQGELSRSDLEMYRHARLRLVEEMVIAMEQSVEMLSREITAALEAGSSRPVA